MKIILLSSNSSMAAAWRRHCSPQLQVSFSPVSQGITYMQHDDGPGAGIVSPANSFGFMDGGLDRAIEREWPGTEALVRHKIQTEYAGELAVGTALYVPLLPCLYPVNLIVAPTMRSPEPLPPGSIAPYLAARAALALASRLGLQSVALPAFGNGVGRMSADTVAHQVAEAIRRFRQPQAMPETWQDAAADTRGLRAPRH